MVIANLPSGKCQGNDSLVKQAKFYKERTGSFSPHVIQVEPVPEYLQKLQTGPSFQDLGKNGDFIASG